MKSERFETLQQQTLGPRRTNLDLSISGPRLWVSEKKSQISILLGRPDVSVAQTANDLAQDIVMHTALSESGGYDEAEILVFA